MTSPEKADTTELVERLRSPWEVRSLSGVSDIGTRLSEAADAIDRLSSQITQLTEALKPFATTAEQLDREMPHARNGKVTFVHPLDGVLPELYGKTDHECPTWPLPDDADVIDAWRYHDPVPASEHIGIQMSHLRAARAALSPPSIPEKPE